MPRFTDKGYLEILRARERLEKVKVTHYTYSEGVCEYPKRVTPGYADYADEWTNKQWDIVNQLKGEMLHLRQSFVNTLKEIKEQANVKRKSRVKYE